MRALDVDMLNPYGINLDSLLFCEAFLIYCLLERSPLISEKNSEQSNIMKLLSLCVGANLISF